MNVALVHDHLAQDGGAEKVLKVLADLYPDAPIFTLLYEKKQVDKYFRDRAVHPSIIQRLPFGVSHYQWYMPFMPMAVEFFDLTGYDCVVSDASAFAKGVITPAETMHVCYCHTPTRYLWDYNHRYINELRYNKYFKKVISLVLNYVRIWDKLAADRVDHFVANSETVRRRIAKYYRRDSTVIFPPVDLARFSPAPACEDYWLIGGRLAPYKRVDIVIEAMKETGRRLKVFGDGVDLPRLKRLAEGHPNIEFLGRVTDGQKAELYRKALGFINPQEEDFGITVVESLASGRPVLAYGRGGARETVREGENGAFFPVQRPAALVAALKKFNPLAFDPERVRASAMRFSTERFKAEISEFIEGKGKEF